MLVTRISEATVLDVDPRRLWAILRDFGALARWHPDVSDCHIEGGGPSERIGGVRAIHLRDGTPIREQLTGLSDKDMTYSYSVIESPLPLTYHTSAVCLSGVDRDRRTVVTWSAEFSLSVGDPEQFAASVRQNVILSGFDGIRSLVTRLTRQ